MPFIGPLSGSDSFTDITGSLYITGSAVVTGTLVVTGSTTLTVFGPTVLNEGGHDHDFRVETDGNEQAIHTIAKQNIVSFLKATSADLGEADVNFFVSGTAASEGSDTRGVALFHGDLVTSGNLHVKSDQITGSITKLSNGLSYIAGTGGVSVISGTNGQIIISGSVDTAGSGGGGSARSVAGDTDNGVITWVTSDNTFKAESTLTFDGTDALVSAAGKVQLRDTGLFINSSHDGHLQISSDGVLALTGSTTIEADSPITASNGLHLDGDGPNGMLQMGAGKDFQVEITSDDVLISNITSNKDIKFSGNSGGHIHEIARFDGSAHSLLMAGSSSIQFGDAGTEMFQSSDGTLLVTSDGTLSLEGVIAVETDSPLTASAGINVDADGLGLFQAGASNDLLIGVVSDDAIITNMAQDKDIIFKVNDGGGGGINTEVMRVNGDASNLAMNTNKKITFDGTTSVTEFITGDGTDLKLGSSNYVNLEATGLSFTNQATLISLTNGDNAALTIEDGEGGNAMLTFDTNGGIGTVADVLVGASDASAGQYTLSPAADNVCDLGSSTKRWRNIFTGDLHLANERGDWTMIEESDFLTLRNNKTGKRFKILMEILPDDGE